MKGDWETIPSTTAPGMDEGTQSRVYLEVQAIGHTYHSEQGIVMFHKCLYRSSEQGIASFATLSSVRLTVPIEGRRRGVKRQIHGSFEAEQGIGT